MQETWNYSSKWWVSFAESWIIAYIFSSGRKIHNVIKWELLQCLMETSLGAGTNTDQSGYPWYRIVIAGQAYGLVSRAAALICVCHCQRSITSGSVQNSCTGPQSRPPVTATQMSHRAEEEDVWKRGGRGGEEEVSGLDANDSLREGNYKHTFAGAASDKQTRAHATKKLSTVAETLEIYCLHTLSVFSSAIDWYMKIWLEQIQGHKSRKWGWEGGFFFSMFGKYLILKLRGEIQFSLFKPDPFLLLYPTGRKTAEKLRRCFHNPPVYRH